MSSDTSDDISKTTGRSSYTGWEHDQNKHIFILSSSGKPIFSKYGDENELVTTFGLLQAVISIVIDSGDSIKCIRAGNRKIVYFIKQSLYFICVTSTNEPELIILKQLQFLYSQILLVLTSKVHDIFRKNPSSDIRQLLGSDTMRLMHTTCQDPLTSTPIAFESIQSVTCCKEIREEITSYLSHCVDQSKAVLGILLYKDKLLGYELNGDTPLHLTTTDVILLTNFVANSNSLRYNDHNWVPICMPEFNDSGLLQAYVSDFKVSTISSSDKSPQSQHPSTTASAIANSNNNSNSNKSSVVISSDHCRPMNSDDTLTELTIILIASSADPDVFKQLLLGKNFIEKALNQDLMAQRLLHTIHHEQHLTVESYLESTGCLHFMFKYRPRSSSKTYNNKDIELLVNNQKVPSQFIATTMRFPLDSLSSQECIWTQYQRLSICLRNGSSTVETTLLPIIAHTTINEAGSPSSDHKSSSKSSSTRNNKANNVSSPTVSTSFAMKQSSYNHINGTTNYTSNRNNNSNSSKLSKQLADESIRDTSTSIYHHSQQQETSEEAASHVARTEQLLSTSPSSDHSLSYIVLATGMVVVALATYDSELFVTFPATISPLEACTTADVLTRALKVDACELFQVNL